MISPTGGGVAGGNLAPGTYFAYYTFTNAAGVESFPSPNSAPFTVAAGNVPRVTLPALPAWATGIKLYLSNPLAQPGSTILYASGITTTALNLTSAAPAAGLSPVPLVNPTGGNATGLTGNLAPGTYFVFFTFNNAAGAEVYASASSAPFVVAHSGDIPQVTLPTLPPWASSYNIYLSNATATPGSATPYACGVTTPTYDLQAAPHSGGATTLLVGDNFNLPATAQVSARQSVTVRGDFGNVNPGTTAALDPDPGVGTVMNIYSAIVAPNVLLTGQNDNETFNVQATAPGSKVTFDTGAGANVINLGSKQPDDRRDRRQPPGGRVHPGERQRHAEHRRHRQPWPEDRLPDGRPHAACPERPERHPDRAEHGAARRHLQRAQQPER